jgi:predicted GNAT family acetyltransferase
VLTVPVRRLGGADRAAIGQVLAREPIAGVLVAERMAQLSRFGWPREAVLLGYGRRTIESICWAGVNVVPVGASPAAVAAFAEVLSGEPRWCSSIVGPAAAVLGLWDRLGPGWGPCREIRRNQPLLVTAADPPVASDPEVRLATMADYDALFPAAVAMYTEEVGVSPLLDGGGGYRERVADLIRNQRAYLRLIDGQVAFKAELAVVSPHTAQVQGVWVAPPWRGRGLATAAMAAVVRDARQRVAPTVSLYVNDFNAPARAVYAKCGFRSAGTFASVLF